MAPEFPTCRCVTCADEAREAEVLEVNEAAGLARVSLGGELLEVDISLVDRVAPGASLLIHGGVAIATIEKETS